jgi:NADH-quinone oxidoreductase subunit G
VATLVGGRATNEEGFLAQRLVREGLRSADIDSAAAEVPLTVRRALADPALQAAVADLEFANAVVVLGCEPLDDAPILDLRIRKGVRRNGVKLAIAGARPSALDPNAALVLRTEPGDSPDFDRLGEFVRDAGDEVVIVYGEHVASAALLEFARSVAGKLLEVPAGSNGRGLREAGCLPNAAPGLSDPPQAGRSAQEMAAAEDVTAFYLFETDPVRDRPDRALWERALHRAGLVVAHASVLTEGIREHANVVFPAESQAEKEGTLVHPDGRVQRMRAAIGHPDEVRPGWWVLAELAKRVGLDTGVLTSGMAFAQLVEAVPFYAGLTLDELGGRGVRWPEREAASALLADGRSAEIVPTTSTTEPAEASAAAGVGLRLGRYRPIWADPQVEISPALQYTIARQQVELSPEDAQRLGIGAGETVEVSQNGTRLTGTAQVRSGVPVGTAFLAEGIAENSANALTEDMIEVRKP